MSSLKKLFVLLIGNNNKKIIFFLFIITLMAIIDIIGIASIMPFIAVLTDPSLIDSNFYLNKLYFYLNVYGLETKKQFVFLLGIIVFLLLTVSLALKALTSYIQFRFVFMREYTLSKILVERYLHQPYSWFFNRHSSDLGKNILSEVNQVVNYGLMSLVNLFVYSFIAISIVTLLIIVDPKLIIIISLSLVFVYLIIYKFNKIFLEKISSGRLKANNERFKSVVEAFTSIKELKIDGLEKFYINRFSDPAKKNSQYQASFKIIAELPRYALELFIFGGMMLVLLYFLGKDVNFINILPKLSLFAFAGYRLIPILQKIYASITHIKFIIPSLNNLNNDLKLPKNEPGENSKLSFNTSIVLKNINFYYPKEKNKILKDISLTIPAKSKVAFVGNSGCGKTTIVDLIVGLLEAQDGIIKIDHQIIDHNNVRAWQSLIGYVPQDVSLIDDTVLSNITLGKETKDIDLELVKHVAKIAQIHDFIVNELSDQYYTKINERGVRLSGGQIKRIGIARALYKNPKILILDEATSALDNQTEKVLIESINKQFNNLTIIMIAHKLITTKDFDIIFLIKDGKIEASGKYNELEKTNKLFKEMKILEM